MRLMQDQAKQVHKLQTKLEQEKEVSKTLKKTVSVVSRNLQLRETEVKVLHTRAEEQFIKNKQQVDRLVSCQHMVCTTIIVFLSVSHG